MVVVDFPSHGLLSVPCDNSELFPALELIRQLQVEALRVVVHARRSLCDIQRVDLQPGQTFQDREGNELGTIVRADCIRHAPHREQLHERVQLVLASDASQHLQGQTLASLLSRNRPQLLGKRLANGGCILKSGFEHFTGNFKRKALGKLQTFNRSVINHRTEVLNVSFSKLIYRIL